MADPGAEPPRLELRADCARCVGLCCVVPGFSASADFAIDKPARQPCPHLGTDFACTIHEQLRDRGFPGCTVYDCFGAGQRVVQVAREGGDPVDWRLAVGPDREPPSAVDPAGPAPANRGLFEAFAITRQLHELLWYLTAALSYPAAQPIRSGLLGLVEEIEQLSGQPAQVLATLDVIEHRTRVNGLLRQVSTAARSTPPRSARRRERRPVDLSGADLIGLDLRRRSLRRADLRGAYLLGADLRGVDLGLADLLGADLRGADVRGADLSAALFPTQMQVNAARGDAATRLPDSLQRPAHWSSALRP